MLGRALTCWVERIAQGKAESSEYSLSEVVGRSMGMFRVCPWFCGLCGVTAVGYFIFLGLEDSGRSVALGKSSSRFPSKFTS